MNATSTSSDESGNGGDGDGGGADAKRATPSGAASTPLDDLATLHQRWRKLLAALSLTEHGAASACTEHSCFVDAPKLACEKQLWQSDAPRRAARCAATRREATRRQPLCADLLRCGRELLELLAVVKLALEEEAALPLAADLRATLARFGTDACHVAQSQLLARALRRDAQLALALAHCITHDAPTLCADFHRSFAPRRAFDVSPLPAWPAIALPVVAVAALAAEVDKLKPSNDCQAFLGARDAARRAPRD